MTLYIVICLLAFTPFLFPGRVTLTLSPILSLQYQVGAPLYEVWYVGMYTVPGVWLYTFAFPLSVGVGNRPYGELLYPYIGIPGA